MNTGPSDGDDLKPSKVSLLLRLRISMERGAESKTNALNVTSLFARYSRYVTTLYYHETLISISSIATMTRSSSFAVIKKGSVILIVLQLHFFTGEHNL